MPIIKLAGFGGENPRTIPRLLADSYAQYAYNTRLDDGSLTPIRKSRHAHSLPEPPAGGYKSLYRNGNEWLAWSSRVYLAPGPVASDRLYIMGDGAPKMRIGGVNYSLRLDPPTGRLGASVTGTATSDLGSTRLYVYTNVTQWGEESEPSPVSADIYWKPGQTVTLSGFAAPVAGRGVTRQRIYRAQTSTTGTLLYFIAERDASTADYADNVALEAINEPVPSLDWNAPPDDLTGLISLPNGMMAAFRGKELFFCEPFRPHAWPEKYILTTDYPIVGLGAFGTTLVVVTTGHPYMVAGIAPDSMTMEKLELNLPCINANAIVDLGYAVVYPSHDGLVSASSAGAQLLPLFHRKDWMAMNPQTMIAAQHNGRYILRYHYSDHREVEYRGAFIIDLTGEQPYLVRTDAFPDAMFYELASGKLFMAMGSGVNEWDAEGAVNAVQYWRSKLFVTPKPINFGALMVESDNWLTEEQQAAMRIEAQEARKANLALLASGADLLHGMINGAAVNEYAVAGDTLAFANDLTDRFRVTVNVIADGKTIASTGKLNRTVRLPAGFLASKWEVEISGDTQIVQVVLAGTGAELAGV